MDTRSLLVCCAVGDARPGDIIDWACDELAAGRDGAELRRLAGYLAHEARQEPQEFREQFQRTLHEQGFEMPPPRAAYTDYACFICRAMLDASLPPARGARILYQVWSDSNTDPDYRSDGRFDIWVYLQDSLELIADGYGPLHERLAGLRPENHESFARREAERFLDRYGSEQSST